MKVFRDIELPLSIPRPVVTIGSFDGVHLGHKKLIARIVQLAKEYNGESVLITFYPHPRQIVDPQGVKMLTTLEEQLVILESLGVQNVVVVPFNLQFAEQSPTQYIENFLLRIIQPICLVIGYDHKYGKDRKGDINLLKSYSDRIEKGIIEISKKEIDNITISSSKVRQYIQQGDLTQANALLDYYYILSGRVVGGDRIGKTLGYPTANIELSASYKLLPKPGIYAAKIAVSDEIYSGMLYIGDRPSINNKSIVKIEINIFDFDQDIYQQEVILSIYKRIRDDQKFDSLTQLSSKLGEDEIAVRSYFQSIEQCQPNIPQVCIAILVYNSAKRLEKYLPSVTANLPEDSEVVIIDNGSTDDSTAIVTSLFPEMQVFNLKQNHGYAGGYNLGLKSVENKYIVLLNDDVKVDPNWLKPMIDLMENDVTIAACMPQIRAYNRPTHYEYAGANGGYMDMLGIPFCRGRILDTVEELQPEYDTVQDIFWATGAAFVIRQDLFVQFEGFDADYFAHQEEIDLCWRLKNAGFAIKVVPESIVYHQGGGTLDYSNPRKVYLNHRNNHWTILKNEQVSKLLWIIPIRFVTDLASAAKYLVEGKVKHMTAVISGLAAAYVALPTIIRKRRHVRKINKQYAINKPDLRGKLEVFLLWRYFFKGQKTFKSITTK